jgi:hypothetical protein
MLMKAEAEFGDLRLPHWTTLLLLTQIRSARLAAAAVNESATAVPLAAAGKKQPQVVGLQSWGNFASLSRDGCHRDVEQHPGREVVPSSNPVEQPPFWIRISGGAELSSQPC